MLCWLLEGTALKCPHLYPNDFSSCCDVSNVYRVRSWRYSQLERLPHAEAIDSTNRLHDSCRIAFERWVWQLACKISSCDHTEHLVSLNKKNWFGSIISLWVSILYVLVKSPRRRLVASVVSPKEFERSLIAECAQTVNHFCSSALNLFQAGDIFDRTRWPALNTVFQVWSDRIE